MMLGVLFLPLIVLGFFELLLALVLLAPTAIARPLLPLAKQSRTPVGWTILGTVSVILLVFAASSAVEIGEAHSRRVRENGGELDALHRRHSEVSAWLSLVLTTADLLLIFVLQKLATVLSDRERMRVSQEALLKQVHGLHSEYERLRLEHEDGQNGLKVADKDRASKQTASLQAAQKQNTELQESLQLAQKRARAAEANMEALKTQAKGLENEYDRLLAEHDALKRRLSRSDPTFEGMGSKKGS